MKRKMLVIAGLLGICLEGSVNRPVLAGSVNQPVPEGGVNQPALECSVNQPLLATTYPFCSSTYCATADPGSFCTCPPGTEAYRRVGPYAYTECNNYTWQADCNYL